MRAKGKKLSWIVFLLAFAILIILPVCYLLFTTRGSLFIVRSAFLKYAHPAKISIEQAEGCLLQALSLQNIEISDLKGLPEGSTFKVQRLEVDFSSLGPQGLNLNIENGRLSMPGLGPALIYGECRNGSLNFNIYIKKASLRAISDLFLAKGYNSNTSGIVSDFDGYLKDSISQPTFTGKFYAERFSREGFSLAGSAASFDLTFKEAKDGFNLFGKLVFRGGKIAGPKTAVIDLEEGAILFEGDIKNLSLNLKGSSTIEGTKIDITLRGSMDKPDLKLTSMPAASQVRLLAMLATGKSWKDAESTFTNNGLPVGLIKDFIDYFVLSGSGGRMADQLGLSDLSISYDQKTKGLGVTKGFSDRAEASYSVAQSQDAGSSPGVTRKIGGELKVIEGVSVGGEKELKPQDKNIYNVDKHKAKDSVFLKFKKEF